jgi:hypothetical protein
MLNKNGKILIKKEHLAKLQINLDALLLCSNLLCRKFLQVSGHGPGVFG